MRHIEETTQTECVKWFTLQYRKFALLLHHSPNGGFRNPREAHRFKLMGTRAGFPDLILLIPSGGFHALFVEFKSPKGTQRTTQKEYQKAVEAQGYKYVIVRSVIEFVKEITKYLKGE